MTTFHDATAQRAIEHLKLLVLQAGSKFNRDDVRHFMGASVGVFVQLELRGGRRRVRHILLAK